MSNASSLNTQKPKGWTKAEKCCAQSAVGKAVAKGILPHVSKHQCERCGVEAQAYHHESYDRQDWLKVTPLCDRCHMQRHAEIKRGSIPYTRKELYWMACDRGIKDSAWRKSARREELIEALRQEV